MNKLRGMVFGSFVADAMALGPHWIYDQSKIKDTWSETDPFVPPIESYHKTKEKGDFTHYGDQVLMYFQFLKMNHEFDEKIFYKDYNVFMESYDGYKDAATKETLDHLSRNVLLGSRSNELGGATGFFIPLWLYPNSIDKALELAIKRTKLTHNDDVLLQRGEFLVNWLFTVLKGDSPRHGLDKIKSRFSDQINSDIEKALSMLSFDSQEAISEFGQSCNSDHAFPASIYYILKYQEDYKNALIQNIYGGGDSAARGMVIGAILGAYLGESAIPVQWMASLNHFKEIDCLMK
jgi:ADP-ribosylglycohydrolase